MKVAILTPGADYSADWRWTYDVEAGALAAAGAEVSPIRWSDPFDSSAFDLVLPIVAWGYHKHFDHWLALLDRLERQGARVENPVPLLRWNSDKAYLAELYEKGVPVVPTELAESLDEKSLERIRGHFGCSDLVVKPPVSASAYLTFPVRAGDVVPEAVRGRRMMVQPWLESIHDTGEWSLIFIDSLFTHAVLKRPAPGDFRVQPRLGGTVEAGRPPDDALAAARTALAALPCPPLYARIDGVATRDGFRIMEVEVNEPGLFFTHGPEGAERLAAAILRAL